MAKHAHNQYRPFIVCFGIGLFLLVTFFFVSRAVRDGYFTTINFDTTVRLQDNIPHRVAELFEDASFFVSPFFSVLWVSALTIFAFFSQGLRKLTGGALSIPIFFALSVFAEVYGKTVVHSPAPPFFMLKNPTTIFPTYYVQESYSYPSGHAARSFFLAVVLWLIVFFQSRYFHSKHLRIFIPIGVGIGLFLLASLISIGKVYLGHHWVADILGGSLVGIGFGLLTCGFLTLDQKK